MVFDARFSDASATPCAAVFPRNGGLVEGFLLSRQVMECTDRTLGTYRSRLGQFLKFLATDFPEILLQDVRRQHIESYLVWLKANGRAAWTLRTSYRALYAFYRWMLEEQFIEMSPLVHIKPPRVPKVGKPFLTQAQRHQLLEICPLSRFTGARANAMIWLLWSTGMRFSELAGLNLADLEWERNRIRVFGKGRKERYVPFTNEAKRAVWRYLTHRRDELPQLWLTEERTPLHARGVQVAIRRIYERAGLKVKDEFHIFRRTWAMRNLKAGVPIKYVQLVGGWESVITLETYVRAMESEDALAANWV